MKDLIILSGAPGSGKTTIAKILQPKLQSPYIDFGWLREWHLLPDWSNQNDSEMEMAFENLVLVLQNYVKHGYKNILLSDLRDSYVIKLAEIFPNSLVVSLLVEEKELRKRVSGERDSGFKNADAAIAWNKTLRERHTLPNEKKIDNSLPNPQEAADKIIALLKS